MNELIQQLKDKANLTDEQALQVLRVMKDYIYAKVPPMFTGMVDKYLKDFVPGNGSGAAPIEDDILD